MNKLESLSRSWPAILAIMSALGYTTGYIKLYCLLSLIGVPAVPTDVYEITSVLVSGISVLVETFLAPTMVLILSFSLSYLPIARHKPLLVPLPGLVVIAISSLWLARFPDTLNPLPYWLIHHAGLRGKFVSLVLFSVMSFYILYRESKPLSSMCLVISICFWVALVIFEYGIISNLVTTGMPPAMKHCSGLVGGLMTTISIANNSYEQTSQGNTAYVTTGILLNIRKGHYYFVPMFNMPKDAESDRIEPELIVIPADKVIFFFAG